VLRNFRVFLGPGFDAVGWWGVAGMVVCLERGAALRTSRLMPLPLTVSCFSKIQIGFTFLVSAHLGSPRQMAVKRVCVLFNLLFFVSFATVCIHSGEVKIFIKGYLT